MLYCHLQIYRQRRFAAELPCRGRHQMDPLRCRSAGHRPHPGRRDAPRPCRLQGPSRHYLPTAEECRGHGGPRGHQAGVRHRPLHRSPGRIRHPDHVFQQHSHHLRDSQSGWHMYLERFILSTHRTLISSKPNNKKTPEACDSSGEDGKTNWNSVPFCMLCFTTLHL